MSKRTNPAAVSLGKLGGKARARTLTKSQRAESAKQAAAARWRDHQLSPEGLKRKQRREKLRKGKRND